VALAYSSKIENYPGLINPISGSELLGIFRKQAIKFGAEYTEAQVVGVKKQGFINAGRSSETYIVWRSWQS